MSGYTAKRLPTHLGPAAWAEILGDAPLSQPLDSDCTADFVVVGGGFAGLSAARRLRQLDSSLRVFVLEAGRLAEGAAGRNSGFMIDLPHELTSDDYAGAGDDRTLIALNRQAIEFAAHLVDDYRISPDFFDRAGKVNGAASETAHAHNLSYAMHLESLREGSEMLDGAAMEALTGSKHYFSGLYTPGTVMLQPAGYICGLGAGLARDGVRICENTPVTGFIKKGSGWKVQTPRGVVTASKVILANNGHLESFGVARGRLMQLFLFASMTPELDADALAKLGGAPRWGITPSDPMGTTMRRIDSGQGGNRIVTRTCAVLKQDMQPRQAHLDRADRVMQHKFAQRFPQLSGLNMEYTWAGHLCLSLNSVAVTGEIDHGVFSACVQNGLGTARGTLTGICAVETAMGVTSEITRHFAGEAQPKRLPPQPFAEIGTNVVLRYKEWRARDD